MSNFLDSSPNLRYLEVVFPCAAALSFADACRAINIAAKTGRNLKTHDKFPIPTYKEGKLVMCAKLDVATYLDRRASEAKRQKNRPAHNGEVES